MLRELTWFMVEWVVATLVLLVVFALFDTLIGWLR